MPALPKGRVPATNSAQNPVGRPLSGEDQGFPSIVMEFLEGQTLDKLLESAPLDKAVALPLIMQISSALDYAHGRGVMGPR